MNIMNKTTTDSFVDILFQMEWESDHALHRDGYRAQKVNMWRDCFPESMYREIMGRPVGTRSELVFEPGQALRDICPRRFSISRRGSSTGIFILK